MSNFFATSSSKTAGSFSISNGGTDVFLAVLCLAGTPLARTPQEVKLMLWLASQDQSLIGRGVAGFDIANLPWEPTDFDANRAFLVSVAAAAKTRVGWDRLDYVPPPDLVDCNLDRFAALILALEPGDVAWDQGREPILGWPEVVQLCAVHGTYQHAEGCLICNDC